MIFVLKREKCRRILKSILLSAVVYSNVVASMTSSTAAPSVR